MCRALVSANGLENEIYSCVVRLFRLMDYRTAIFMCSALVSAHGD